MNKLTNARLDIAVKKSLGYDPTEAEKWSIVQCAKNEYLDPAFDPFYLLKIELMAYSMRTKYGFDAKID